MIADAAAAVRARREDAAAVHDPEHAPRDRHQDLVAGSPAGSAWPGLQPGHLTVRLRGSAGQSLGAFAVQGLKLEVFGDANDYVGKGLSGATIVVRPPPSSTLRSNENTIIGNTVLYGATAGTLFAAGQAGERFAVRNSGARRGGRRLRLQRLRIHDRRHGGDARRGRRQFRRRLHRRHGVRLRPGRPVRDARQSRHADLAARGASALGAGCCAIW